VVFLVQLDKVKFGGWEGGDVGREDFEEFEGGAGFVLLDFGFAGEGIASLTCDPSFGGGGVATALDSKD